MGDKDLEKIISSIGQEEQAAAQKQVQIDRLKQLVEKQKKEIAERDAIVRDLQQRVGGMYEIPADVEELKHILGEQRSTINGKDKELEIAFGKIAEYEGELKNIRLQYDPIVRNMEAYISQVGELKAKLIEYDAIVKTRDRELAEAQMEIQNAQERNRSFDDYINQIGELKAKVMESDALLKMKESEIGQNKVVLENAKKMANRMETEYSSKVGDISKGVQDSFSQISALKTELMERDSKIAKLEKKIEEENANIAPLKQFNESLKKEVDSLRGQIMKIELAKEESKIELEKKIREEVLSSQTEYKKKIPELQNQIMNLELKVKEANNAEKASKMRLDDYRSKYDDLAIKYETVMAEKLHFDDKLKVQSTLNAELQSFYIANKNIALNMERLVKMFETEALFKTFNIVKTVGEVTLEELKGALGVPTVTVQKFIQIYQKYDLFAVNEQGRISLKYR
jgi:chromosome segregation ATPase